MPSTSRRICLTLIQLSLAVTGLTGIVVDMAVIVYGLFLVFVCTNIPQQIARGVFILFVLIIPVIYFTGLVKTIKLRRSGDFSNNTLQLGLGFLTIPIAIVIFLVLMQSVVSAIFPYLGSCSL